MKADGAKEYQYAVVQFLKLSRANVGDYVCIPRSWIQMRTERKIRVAYPSERPLVTSRRIKAGESPSDDWKRYMAVVKVEAYTYKEAKEFIMKKKYDALTSDLRTSVVGNGITYLPAAAAEKNSCSTKRARQSEKKVKKIKVDDKYNIITSSSKAPESSNNEPTINDFPEKIIMEGSSSQEVISHDVAKDNPSCISGNTLPSQQNQLFRYPYLQRIPELSFGIQNMSPEIGCEGSISISRPINTTKDDPLDSIKKYFQDFPEPLKTQLSPRYPNQVLSQITNMPSQHNQVSMSSPVCPDSGQALPTGKVSVDQSSAADQGKSTQISLGEQDYSQDSELQPMMVDRTSVAGIELNNVSEQSTGSESSDVTSSTENVGQSTGSSTEETLMTIDKVTTGDVSSTQDVDDDDDASFSPGVTIEEALGDNQSSSKQADQSVESLMKKVDNRADQLIGLLQMMKIDFKHSAETAFEMHKSYAKSIKVVELIENAFDSIRKSEKDKVTVVKPKEVVADVQKVDEKKQAEMKEAGKLDEGQGKSNNNVRNQGEDDDGNEDREALSKTREHIRGFVLPPEYDPNDSWWTLKYRENDPTLGLVELVPDSNKFVNPIQLAHCKRVAKDAKALARMLLAEIFTQSALSVCSLTGARANAFYSNGSDVRPASLRSRIHEIRYKHGKTKWLLI